MKVRFEIDGVAHSLELRPNGSLPEYLLEALGSSEKSSGSFDLVEIAPGVCSVLIGGRSFTVHVAAGAPGTGADWEVWANSRERHAISGSDVRDRVPGPAKASANGPVKLRAQMPGKVVKLLVAAGAAVEAGQGLIVVEAMKMQNEMKSPKSGTVTRIETSEGATVSAGDALLVVE